MVPVLCDSSVGPAVAAEVGRLGETTCVDYLQPAVVTHPDFLARSLGQRLDKSVFDWLASSMKQQPTFDEFAADRSAVTSPVCVLVAEGVFELTAHGGRAPSELAAVAVWRAFSEVNEGAAWIAGLDKVVKELDWTAAQWCRVVEAHPRVVAPRYLLDAVVCDASRADVEALHQHLTRARRGELHGIWQSRPAHDDLAASWAAVRCHGSWKDVGGYDFDRAWENHGVRVVDDYARRYGAGLPKDLLVRLVVFVVGVLARASRNLSSMPVLPHEHVDALADAAAAESEYAVDALADLVDSGVVEPEWLVAHAVFSSPQAPRRSMPLSSSSVLDRFVIGSGSRSRGLLDEAVTRLLPAPWFRGPGAAMAMVRAQLRARGDRDIDRACEPYEAFVVWWFDQRLADADRVVSGPRGSI